MRIKKTYQVITGGKEGPNYAAWPISYVRHGRIIPEKWLSDYSGRTYENNC